MRETVLQVYERSRPQLRAVAARYVGDEADDVVQDAFLKVLHHGSGFRGDSAPLTWLHRVVVNASIDHCRTRTRQEHAHLGHTNPTMANAACEDAFALRMALRQLTPGQRRVFVMYDVLGHKHREIARRLGIPLGTSKGRLSEARRRLQQALYRRAASA